MRPGSARGPAGVEDAGSWLFSLPWLGAAGLLQNERAIDFVGNSDAAGLGEGFRIFFRQHRTPHPGARRVAERAVALDAAGHLRKHRIQKHRLKVLRLAAQLFLRFRRDFCQGLVEQRIRTVDRRCPRESGDAVHHITSMSACIAPAALIACRMPIRSRGPMPRLFKPSTSCCSETPSFTTASFLPSSETPTLERGVTTVRPRENA